MFVPKINKIYETREKHTKIEKTKIFEKLHKDAALRLLKQKILTKTEMSKYKTFYNKEKTEKILKNASPHIIRECCLNKEKNRTRNNSKEKTLKQNLHELVQTPNIRIFYYIFK